MSKKHFAKLAQALSDSKPIMPMDSDKGRQWERDVKAVADVCSDSNERFDYHRFLSACGIPTT